MASKKKLKDAFGGHAKAEATVTQQHEVIKLDDLQDWLKASNVMGGAFNEKDVSILFHKFGDKEVKFEDFTKMLDEMALRLNMNVDDLHKALIDSDTIPKRENWFQRWRREREERRSYSSSSGPTLSESSTSSSSSSY